MAARINNDQAEHHHGSAPPSPSMSQSQQQNTQTRQSVGYPSPQMTSYPSPGPSSAQYSYPAPSNQQQVTEPYRASPTGSNGSLSLPSMRSLDPLQQQTHQQHMAGAALPPPVAQMGPYYHGGQTLPHPQHQYPNVTSDPAGQNMRYALPVPEGRVMSGGRHKKEIKRRTKTGCLTCRKRRIKCDEAHPACRNCQKSKRECMGYDPIFKQQPGPAPIQPAPSAAPSQNPILTTANPYGNQPSMLHGYGAQVPNMGYEPALSAGVSSPGSTSPQYDYTSAIDPALEAVVPPTTKGNSQFQATSSGMPHFRDDLKRDMNSASPYSSGASDSPHLRGGASSIFFDSNSTQFSENEYESPAYASTPAKVPMKIDDLLSLRGPVPPNVPGKLQEPEFLDEIKHLYHSIYSPGLENFLEAKWFPVKGIAKLLGDNQLLELGAILLDQLAKTPADNESKMAYTSSVEARVVWGLASMARTAASESANGLKSEGAMPTLDDATETGNRVTVFENLVCGVVADRNLLTRPSEVDSHKAREFDFWYNLGKFVTLDQAKSTGEMDRTLGLLRLLLDGRENRDVLYSIAIVRAMSNRVAEYSDEERPLHLDESDSRSKLLVAKRHVDDEAKGNGTTNVVRRLCELTLQSWTTMGWIK